MKRLVRFPLLASALAVALVSTPAFASQPATPASSNQAAPSSRPLAPALTEAQKIEALIASVERLKGAVFIRNGTEHDAVKAAAHLRRKLGYAGKKVKTAEQFIEQLATGSSMSGKPYRIRFANGQSVDSAAYFHEQLKRLESPVRKTAKG